MKKLLPILGLGLVILQACGAESKNNRDFSEILVNSPSSLDFDVSLLEILHENSGSVEILSFFKDQNMRIGGLIPDDRYKFELTYLKNKSAVFSSAFCAEGGQRSLSRSFSAGLTEFEVEVCPKGAEAQPKDDDKGVDTEPKDDDEGVDTEPKDDDRADQEAPAVLGYLVQGNKIYKDGQKISLKGINWFGFDTGALKPHGLWTGRSYDNYMSEIKEVGFNALRIPVSPEAIDQQMELRIFLDKANEYGLHVLLDIHNCSFNDGHLSPIPCDNTIPSLEKLASLIEPYDNVVGIDVFNEPYGYTWAQWKSFVEEAAAAIHKISPDTLIFAEGIGGEGDDICTEYPSENDECMQAPFWGENLSRMDTDPINVSRDKLVLAPHAYGPAVYGGQIYFNVKDFPGNMPAIWDVHFGKLASEYPIAIGEFGGTLDGLDQIWQESFVEYLVSKDIEYFFYWSLNPNSGDTGGIYYDDWQTFNQEKLRVLEPILSR